MNSTSRTLSLAKRGILNFFLKRPFCVSFEVTYSCNARCKHCHLGGPVQEERATPQKFGERSLELRPVVAQVSGGEPLLRRDLDEVIKAIKIPNRAPYIVVTTNGVLLTKKRYDELRNAGVDEFSLSLDYPDERHDEFRGIPGLFNRLKTLVQDLDSENHKAITLSCVVQSDNFRELLKMAELARKWEVKINFSIYTWLRTKNKDYMLGKEELEELKEILGELHIFKKRHKIVHTSDYVFKKMIDYFEKGFVPKCRAGQRFFIVNPDATLSPCGLIIKKYNTWEEMKHDFMKSNDCVYCFTSIRGNSERPARYLIKDSLRFLQ